MRFFLLAALVLGLSAAPVAAVDLQGRYRIYGAGDVRCDKWAYGRKNKDSANAQDEDWIAGYVTAYNRWVHKGRSLPPSPDPESLYVMIDKLCAENPQETLSGATESMILDLIRQQP